DEHFRRGRADGGASPGERDRRRRVGEHLPRSAGPPDGRGVGPDAARSRPGDAVRDPRRRRTRLPLFAGRAHAAPDGGRHRSHPPSLDRCRALARPRDPPSRRGGSRARQLRARTAERSNGGRGPSAPALQRTVGGMISDLINPTTVALALLLLILVVAATSRLWVAIATSIVAMLAFNFFFLPPVGTFTIADPQNWVALFAFLVVSVVASQLSSTARARAEEAVARRDEMARLFDLSRDVLMITDSHAAIGPPPRFTSPR